MKRFNGKMFGTKNKKSKSAPVVAPTIEPETVRIEVIHTCDCILHKLMVSEIETLMDNWRGWGYLNKDGIIRDTHIKAVEVSITAEQKRWAAVVNVGEQKSKLANGIVSVLILEFGKLSKIISAGERDTKSIREKLYEKENVKTENKLAAVS